MKGFVLDSYALIAYFEDEQGADKVEQILEQSERDKINLVMTIINWGEVYYSIYRSKGEEKAEECLLVIEQFFIELVEADRELVYQAARLKANHSTAIGDCFAASVAIKMGYPVINR
jgi:ribonuclease VapC